MLLGEILPRSFRLAQRRIDAPWEPVIDADDAELGGAGYETAGTSFHTDDLTPEERAELLLFIKTRRRAQSREELTREEALMQRCPQGRLPSIDIDVRGPAQDKADMEALGNRISEAMEGAGWGHWVPFWSGGAANGIHLDAPPLLRPATDAARRFGLVVDGIMSALGVRALHTAPKDYEGPAYDTAMFSAAQGSRGHVWRLSGATRSKDGNRKTAIAPTLVRTAPLDLSCLPLIPEPIGHGADKARERKLRDPIIIPSGSVMEGAAKVVRSVSDGECDRHEARLAFSGMFAWEGVRECDALAILERGIPSTDPTDNERAISDTYDRFSKGARVKGRGKVASIFGKSFVTKLRAALKADVLALAGEKEARKVWSGEHLSRVEREFLHARAKDGEEGGYENAARKLHRIAACKKVRIAAWRYEDTKDDAFITAARCRSAFCPGCSQTRARVYSENVSNEWPETMFHSALDLGVEDPEAIAAAVEAATSALSGVDSTTRWVKTPSGAHMFASTARAMSVLAALGWKGGKIARARAMSLVRDSIVGYSLILGRGIERQDMNLHAHAHLGLKVVRISSATKAGEVTFPWLSQKDIQAILKAEIEEDIADAIARGEEPVIKSPPWDGESIVVHDLEHEDLGYLGRVSSKHQPTMETILALVGMRRAGTTPAHLMRARPPD